MDFKYVYCLFCRSGSERQIAREIEVRFPHTRAIAAVQEKHRIIAGRYEADRRIFLPGYIFLYTDTELDFLSIHRMERVYKILGGTRGLSALSGRDRLFAEWIWLNRGFIGISKLRMNAEGFEVLSGPLQYFLKEIVRIDKHTKNALVKMDFLDQALEIWLAFDFEPPAETGASG